MTNQLFEFRKTRKDHQIVRKRIGTQAEKEAESGTGTGNNRIAQQPGIKCTSTRGRGSSLSITRKIDPDPAESRP